MASRPRAVSIRRRATIWEALSLAIRSVKPRPRAAAMYRRTSGSMALPGTSRQMLDSFRATR
jgi:hypothetical protein